MSEPLIVTIPHRLGKAEALRRIKDGIARAKTEFAYLLRIENDAWEGDRLSFAASALGQRAHGVIDVYEGAVRLEVTLPWLLGALCPRGAARGRAARAVDAGEEIRSLVPRPKQANSAAQGRSYRHQPRGTGR